MPDLGPVDHCILIQEVADFDVLLVRGRAEFSRAEVIRIALERDGGRVERGGSGVSGSDVIGGDGGRHAGVSTGRRSADVVDSKRHVGLVLGVDDDDSIKAKAGLQ